MAPEDGLLIKYDQARRWAKIESGKFEFGKKPEEIAQECGLSPAFTRILVSVTNKWHGLGKSDEFVAEMDEIFHDLSVEPAARALAAEHASSNFKDHARRERGMAAIMVTGLGEQDRQQILDSVIFGEWDAAGKTIHEEDVDAAMDRFIDSGAYNAPGRAMWWYEVLEFRFDAEPAVRQKARALLERVRGRCVRKDYGFNEHHLRRVIKKLRKLEEGEE